MKTNPIIHKQIFPIVVIPLDTVVNTIRELRSAGYVPVLCDDPSKISVIMPESRVSGDDLLMACMYGLSGDASSAERSKAMEELYRRLVQNEKLKIIAPK